MINKQKLGLFLIVLPFIIILISCIIKFGFYKIFKDLLLLSLLMLPPIIGLRLVEKSNE